MMVKKLVVNYKDKKIASKWALPQVFNHAAIQLATDSAMPNDLKLGDVIQITATVREGKIQIEMLHTSETNNVPRSE